MQRTIIAMLILGTVALVAGGLAVWRGHREPVAGPPGPRQVLGPGKTVGKSALSHGGAGLEQTRSPEKMGSASDRSKKHGDDHQPDQPDGGNP